MWDRSDIAKGVANSFVMLLGDEGRAVFQPAGGISGTGAGRTQEKLSDSVTHWRVECNSGFKF